MEYALEGDLKSFGRGFTVLEKVMAPRFAVSFTSRCHRRLHNRPCTPSQVQAVKCVAAMIPEFVPVPALDALLTTSSHLSIQTIVSWSVMLGTLASVQELTEKGRYFQSRASALGTVSGKGWPSKSCRRSLS